MYFKGLIAAFLLIIGVNAYSQVGLPLPVDSDTIALWNFDSDVGDSVVDETSNPINGTAFNAPRGPIPGLDVLYNEGRLFAATNSFIDLGLTEATKLDLTGSETFTLEAIIRRTGNALGNHTIYENRQIQFLIIDNQLAAFVAQTGGFLGLVAPSILDVDTNYRVGMVLNGGHLSLFINGLSVGTVEINEPVASIIDPNFHGFIGGSILGEFFPGHIDDVRLSSIARFDNLPPVVTQIQPVPGTGVIIAKPIFNFTFLDDSSIDVGSIEVYLNGVVQTGISRDANGINGQMDDDLLTGQFNTVKIVVKDEFGNRAERSFNILRGAIGGRDEYVPDADTLALWHMNGPVDGFIADSSVNNYHAFNPVNQSTGTIVTDGIFGNGREFSASNRLDAPPIRLPGQEFTFETWLRPNDNNTGTIFDSQQIEIQRRTTGFIRIILRPRIGTFDFETVLDEFPVGEKHHLAVTWDGTKPDNNLVVFKDGVILEIFNAPNDCDFNPVPRVAEIGNGFNGMLDEMRFSSVVRSAFNIPTVKEVGIFFLTLQDGTSVNSNFPQINIDINSLITVDPANISILLNDVDQTNSTGLTISATNISGILDEELTPGINSLEVVYRDNDNNLKRKKHHFFYIQSGDGGAYTADIDTAVLLHLDSPNNADIIDSSSNSYPFKASSPTSMKAIPGLIGNAKKGSQFHSDGRIVDLGVRSFTVEGFFRSRQDITQGNFEYGLMRVSRSGFNASIGVNPITGKITARFSSPSSSFVENISGAFPVDESYHHIATIFDSSREFSQYLVLVDGEVKFARNFDCHCNFAGKMDVTIDESNGFETDEFRISKVARYVLNFATTDRPDIIGFNPAIDSTIHTLSPSVEYVFSDPSGISPTETFLLVNGVLQTGLTLDVSGFNGSLSGVINSLIPGANELEIHVKNGVGLEEVKKLFVFVILDGGITAYTTDADTLALYHMDETTGSILADSSDNGFDFNLEENFNLNVLGAFGSSGLISTSSQDLITIVPPLLGIDTYTFEGWVKFGDLNSGFEAFRNNSMSLAFNGFSGGDINFRNSSSQNVLTVNNVITDLNFHHFAAILDPSNPYRNFLIVIDGEVKGSIKASNLNDFILTSENLQMMSSVSLGPSVDEFRISKVARYLLNYSEVKNNESLTRK